MTDIPTATAPEASSSILKTPILDIVCEWLLYVSAALIISGLLMPSVHRPSMMSWVSDGVEYNILQVLGSMWDAQEYVVAIIVFLFSIIFPLAKTLTAAVLFRFGNRASKRAAHIMQFLGKWSMLDVFLVAFLIGMTQLAVIVTVRPLAGLYLFAAGVILNNIATARLSFSRAS